MGTVVKTLSGQPGQGTAPARSRLRRKARRPMDNPLALEDDLLALARAVPDEEWAGLPQDFNENLDHYLYGTPRKAARRV